MSQEDKDLLLKDICARMSYGVKAILSEYHIDEFPYNGTYCDKVINLGICEGTINLLNHIEKYGVRPYLRPMSSMTEDEAKEIAILYGIKDILSVKVTSDYIDVIVDDGVCSTERRTIWYDEIISSIKIFDWLNAHHFDYRGLIERDLAIKAPEGMYNNKEQ